MCDPYSNVAHCPHRMRREWPWVRSVIAMACAYGYRLNLLITEVLQSLNALLQQ